MTRAWRFVWVGVALVAAARPAHAKPQFRDAIAARLAAPPGTPACSVCHLGGKTSGATVDTPFAWTMRAHGLTDSLASVVPAVDGVAADKVDSDGDGVPDTVEISRGTDPNEPGTATDVQDPQLGCQVGGAGGRPPAGGAAALLAGAGAWLVRRRRARR